MKTYLIFVLCTISNLVFCDPPVAHHTTCGDVEGVANDGAFSFRGIPYAEPPVFNLRWKPPQMLSKLRGTCWNGTYKAIKFGSSCFQRDPFNSSSYDGSEDCLYLNVWTPSLYPLTLLPVMVWLHGGSLQLSNGNWPTYSPTEKLARETNIVYVSMNYRLQAFGFMALDILARESPTNSSGNYGFMDIILALQWVQDNIVNFGGDPHQVTLFGQSSGGTAMFALLASPLCKGLFHKGWLLSASPVLNKTAEDAYRDNEMFLDNAGCHDTKCLYSLTSAEVTAAVPWDQYPFWAMEDQGDLPVKGVFDGAIAIVDRVVLPEAPFDAWAKGNIVDVPLLIGTLANEIDYDPGPLDLKNWTWSDYKSHVQKTIGSFGDMIFETAMYMYPPNHITPEYQFTSMASDIRVNCANDYMSLIAASTFKSPIYRYVVTSIPSKPINAMGLPFAASYSFHMWDCYAFFGSIDQYINPLAKSDILWQESVRREVLSFVQKGRPNSVAWRTYPTVTALFAQNVTAVSAYKAVECEFWLQNGFFNYAWIN